MKQLYHLTFLTRNETTSSSYQVGLTEANETTIPVIETTTTTEKSDKKHGFKTTSSSSLGYTGYKNNNISNKFNIFRRISHVLAHSYNA